MYEQVDRNWDIIKLKKKRINKKKKRLIIMQKYFENGTKGN